MITQQSCNLNQEGATSPRHGPLDVIGRLLNLIILVIKFCNLKSLIDYWQQAVFVLRNDIERCFIIVVGLLYRTQLSPEVHHVPCLKKGVLTHVKEVECQFTNLWDVF